MFLFLDAASPIPEFHLINDKKILDSFKIVENPDQKLSDLLIPKYIEINKIYKLSNNIKKLIITIGPGSYTSLRIGASFVAGLLQSMNLPVAVISTETIYDQLYSSSKEIGIYFESSNNQKFFSYKRESNFVHEKIENENYVIPKTVSLVFGNSTTPSIANNEIQYKVFSIKKIILKNLNLLNFEKNKIIKPIYISNNTILN